jgi:uncharacterized protein (DUF3820 family)
LDGITNPVDGTDADSLYVTFYGSAEWGCHLALDWPLPVRTIDLYAEFRNATTGLPVPCGHGLLGALTYCGLDGIAPTEKEGMRELAMRGGPYSEVERTALLDYCQSDVDATAKLLFTMLPTIDFPRALLRGRYTIAAARMEWNGTPVDVQTLAPLRSNWDGIKSKLITEVNRDYGVYVPTGQRDLNPESRFGAAVREAAAARNIDTHRLVEAVEYLWEQERSATADTHAARRAARQATGLTARRIAEWEDVGRDYATYPGLDVTARTLAGAYPALGLSGRGYTSEGGYDDVDYGAELWDILRNRDERTRPRHDPDLIRQAAALVAENPAEQPAVPMTFSATRWGEWLARHDIPWPQLESGALALDDDTFREMARAYPDEVGPMRELRHAVSQLRLNELAVGRDGRNRCLLSVFGSRTSRNQPSNSKFIFGPSTWLRSLIRPEPDRAVAYIDYAQQELAIAAALSGDRRMQEAYTSGDFYLTFAKMAGAVPADGTKETHGPVREQFKVVALGVLYGLSAEGLARKLAVAPICGRELLRLHQETFRTFWSWSDAIQNQAMLTGRLSSVFGWTVRVGTDANPRSLRNFPMQANGAEMLRLACCLATEAGIAVCAPVHDALLVESSADEIEETAAATQKAMRDASAFVLPGFPLRTDAKIVRHPERFSDDRGRHMWRTVNRLLADFTGTPDEGAQEIDSSSYSSSSLLVGGGEVGVGGGWVLGIRNLMATQHPAITMPFGAHKHRPLTELPESYLVWALRECRQLSSGLRVALANELTRRGFTPPPIKPPAPPPKECRNRHCRSPKLAYRWFQDRIGRPQIKWSCAVCGRSMGFMPLLEPFVTWANSQSSETATLDVLIRCDELGIQLSNDGRAVDFATEADRRKASNELQRRLGQCRHDLAKMLPKGLTTPGDRR